MKSTLQKLLIGAAAACGFAAATHAATPFYTTSQRALEANISSVVLPSGAGSSLVLTPCPGCAPKSLPSTASTTYFLKRQQVPLAVFRNALVGKTDVSMTVFQSVKTGELTKVIAALDAPAPVKTK